jgi:hypothetical protein
VTKGSARIPATVVTFAAIAEPFRRRRSAYERSRPSGGEPRSEPDASTAQRADGGECRSCVVGRHAAARRQEHQMAARLRELFDRWFRRRRSEEPSSGV